MLATCTSQFDKKVAGVADVEPNSRISDPLPCEAPER